jgi:ribosome-associated protein
MAAKAAQSEPTAAAQLAARLAREADDLQCTAVCVLDVRGISPVTDFFVIATGNSPRQLRSVADAMADAAAEMGHRLLGVEGRADARWILLDFVDVVVHLFDPPGRSYYDLDLLWGDAPRLEWETADQKKE